MKKHVILLTVLAAVVLAGCSGNGNGLAAAKEGMETAPQTTQSSQATGDGESSADKSPDQSADKSPDKSTDETPDKATDKSEGETKAASDTADVQKHHIKINVKDYGTISVELDPVHAPITVDNFISLAKSGFYNGLTFHRVIDGFMIQGGDPLGTGMGGSDKTIKGEFSHNGVNNPLSNTRGAIAMARSQDMDSASSQFFIVQQNSPYLDGDYAVFGYVTDGMAIVDKICKDTPVTDGNGTVAKDKQPVIESVEVVD